MHTASPDGPPTHIVADAVVLVLDGLGEDLHLLLLLLAGQNVRRRGLMRLLLRGLGMEASGVGRRRSTGREPHVVGGQEWHW